jgi:phage gpG-like protein
MIALDGLRALADRLARLDLPAVQHAALEDAAGRLDAAVRQSLSSQPGGEHALPWLRTGALRASIDHRTDADSAVVGSDDPVAVDQELGTLRIPPRPFLATTAAAHAAEIARSVGAAIAEALNGALR